MEEKRIDMRVAEQADPAESRRCAQLCFKINHTMPFTEEYDKLVEELFLGHIGVGSRVMPPLTVVRGNSVSIGKNVVVMNNALFMAARRRYDRRRCIGRCQCATDIEQS